jgi:hypothetical protein
MADRKGRARASPRSLVLGIQPLYIVDMTVSFDLSPTQSAELQRRAERLGVSASELARAALCNLLASRDDDFLAAATRVLHKNAELYRRLA